MMVRQDILPNTPLQSEPHTSTEIRNAAIIGDYKKLEKLIHEKVNLRIKDEKYGNTPLHEAAWRGYSRCVKILSSQPLRKIANKCSSTKCVTPDTQETLHINYLGIKNKEGFSPLHLAAQNGHNQSCRELLWAGADPNIQNNYGDTPLHTSCRYGHAGATRILISAMCDLNQVNYNGDTALHISCAMGRRKLTKILVEAGCNKDIKNAQDETPADIAFKKNFQEVEDILRNHHKNFAKKVNEQKQSKKSSNKHANDRAKETNFHYQTNWSPYGCHYCPGQRNFPIPNLPKSLLRKGEQYFSDLSGNIHIGPKSPENTCYCESFFKKTDSSNSNESNIV